MIAENRRSILTPLSAGISKTYIKQTFCTDWGSYNIRPAAAYNRCMAGQLYLIGTPIGNLGDITLRALETLRSLDVLFCEDTRVTAKLLQHFGILLETRSLSDDSSERDWDEPLRLVHQGRKVGYVTDAGMPGASDPGRRLARLAWAADIAFTVIPGPSSLSTLLAACPFIDNGFTFIGFAPRKPGEREQFFARIVASRDPLLFFESPQRAHALLDSMCAVLPAERRLMLGREMTKLHEQFLVFQAGNWLELSQRVPALGEFTIAVEGAQSKQERHAEEELIQALKRMAAAGFSKRDAVKAISVVLEHPLNELKKLAYEEDT